MHKTSLGPGFDYGKKTSTTDCGHGQSVTPWLRRKLNALVSNNIANAYRVSTGNGQPSITLYNSTLEFEVDDENDMRILPPTLFVRLRQEKAADRIGRHLFSTHRDWTDEAAIIYLNMQAERLKAERKSVDGVDNGVSGSCPSSQAMI
jgi:hypothetical protein